MWLLVFELVCLFVLYCLLPVCFVNLLVAFSLDVIVLYYLFGYWSLLLSFVGFVLLFWLFVKLVMMLVVVLLIRCLLLLACMFWCVLIVLDGSFVVWYCWFIFLLIRVLFDVYCFAGCLFVSLVYCYLSIWLYSLLVVLVKFCLFAN